MMNAKKWMAVGAISLAVSAISVWAVSVVAAHFRVFRTTSVAVAVSQTSSNGVPRYQYDVIEGHDLVALALGAEPTSNQVFAIDVNCDSTAANLLVFDKSNSNMTVIAQSSSFDKIVQGNLLTGNTNQERFVARFDVQPVGFLAGGFLDVAGRLDLDPTSGCVRAVLVAVDRDPHDHLAGDGDVADHDADKKDHGDILTRRAGQAHYLGVLDVVSGGQTNTVLVPNGHMTFRHELDDFFNL